MRDKSQIPQRKSEKDVLAKDQPNRYDLGIGLGVELCARAKLAVKPYKTCPCHFVSLSFSQMALPGSYSQVARASLQPMLVTLAVTSVSFAKVTDSRMADLRTRLREELKASLKVRSFQKATERNDP